MDSVTVNTLQVQQQGSPARMAVHGAQGGCSSASILGHQHAACHTAVHENLPVTQGDGAEGCLAQLAACLVYQ